MGSTLTVNTDEIPKSKMKLIYRRVSWFIKYLNKDIEELTKSTSMNEQLKYIRGEIGIEEQESKNIIQRVS